MRIESNAFIYEYGYANGRKMKWPHSKQSSRAAAICAEMADAIFTRLPKLMATVKFIEIKRIHGQISKVKYALRAMREAKSNAYGTIKFYWRPFETTFVHFYDYYYYYAGFYCELIL